MFDVGLNVVVVCVVGFEGIDVYGLFVCQVGGECIVGVGLFEFDFVGGLLWCELIEFLCSLQEVGDDGNWFFGWVIWCFFWFWIYWFFWFVIEGRMFQYVVIQCDLLFVMLFGVVFFLFFGNLILIGVGFGIEGSVCCLVFGEFVLIFEYGR